MRPGQRGALCFPHHLRGNQAPLWSPRRPRGPPGCEGPAPAPAGERWDPCPGPSVPSGRGTSGAEECLSRPRARRGGGPQPPGHLCPPAAGSPRGSARCRWPGGLRGAPGPAAASPPAPGKRRRFLADSSGWGGVICVFRCFTTLRASGGNPNTGGPPGAGSASAPVPALSTQTPAPMETSAKARTLCVTFRQSL